MNVNQRLKQLLSKRIVIIDGGMGSLIQQYHLVAKDFGSTQYEGCNDYLVISRPDIIKEIHTGYLQAGADIIETNTFGATSTVLIKYHLAEKAEQINFQAAKIAKECTTLFSKNTDKFVAGSIGPTTKSLIVTGNITFSELQHSYYEQALGLIKGGCDLFLIETGQDTLNMKAAALAVAQAQQELNTQLPVLFSATILDNGTMLAGQDIEAFYTAVRPFKPFAIGMNCATGPRGMKAHLQTLSEISDLPVFIYPNAGLPNDQGKYDTPPEEWAKTLEYYAEKGWLNLVGGCCGTGYEHIKLLPPIAMKTAPREFASIKKQFGVSGAITVKADEKQRPILVGERTNVRGSKIFRELIKNQEFDKALDVGKLQVQNGAQIVDVCLEDTSFDEIDAIRKLYPKLAKALKIPVMIDSTNLQAIEIALQYCQGKVIINSINLEGGQAKLDKLVTLMKKYGAAAIVGVIDENGMAITLERKLQVAERLYNLLTKDYQLDPTDLIFDMLVFTVDTGKNSLYAGAAKATLTAVKQFKEKHPEVKTLLGISNASFGLPPAGREVLNAVYFSHAVKAGLDLAIVNPQTLKRYNLLSNQEIQLAEAILFEKDPQALQKFIEYYRAKETQQEKIFQHPTNPTEAVYQAIVTGMKTGLSENLQTLLVTQRQPAVDIIDKILMKGMEKVGTLFGEGQLLITEVLQSAEVMMEAITYLKPHIVLQGNEKSKKIVLATVKGDVHDIGKNLVNIIFTSNGFEVVDLGINVENATIVDAIQKQQPNILGLSGLLIKSAQQMKALIEDLEHEHIKLPILIGGAALSQNFVEKQLQPIYSGKVFYAKDVMAGLALVNKIMAKN